LYVGLNAKRKGEKMSQKETMRFELSAEETRAYQQWVSEQASKMAGEDEAGLDAVTISFVLTPMGTGVIAHLNKSWDDNSPHIVLREIF
jgi:heme/copper-type cytochrome/quinol oxidase subunit 2